MIVRGLGESEPAPACPWYSEQSGAKCVITPRSVFGAPGSALATYSNPTYGAITGTLGTYGATVINVAAWLLAAALVFGGASRGRR